MIIKHTSLVIIVTFGLLFFILLANKISAQSYEEYDIKELKELYYKTSEENNKAEIANRISELYQLNVEIDSSKKYASLAIEILKNKKDASKAYKVLLAKAIENYGSALAYSNANRAIDTLETSLKLWKEIGDKHGIASGYYSLALAYSLSSNTIESLNYHDKSLSLYREINDKATEAEILHSMSLEKRYLGYFGDALEYSLQSLKVAEEIKDTLLITNALLSNSFNYLLSENYTEALQEQQKALELYELTKDSIGIATTYNDMGVTNMFADDLKSAIKYHKMALNIRKKVDLSSVGISYNYLAEIYRAQGELEMALEYLMEGLPYSIKHEDNRFIIGDYLLVGDIYLDLNAYEKAIENYNSAIEIAKQTGNLSYQAEAQFRIGLTHNEAGKINKALESLKQADQIIPLQDFDRRELIYENMMKIYESRNDYKNAYIFQTKFHAMSDSVSAAIKEEKITKLTQELMYENKRAIQKASQDKEIAVKESQLKTQKIIRNISIAGLLLILVFAVIFYIRFKEKRKLSLSLEKTLSELKETQQQLIQSEKMASLGELTAGIAHEIQNPLNFVNNFSEVSKELLEEMQEEIENGDFKEVKAIMQDIVQNLEKINHHGKRADGIVKGMLQHSRVGGDKTESTDINALADEYLRLAYHGLRAKDKSFNAELITDFDKSIKPVKVIPQDIGRVILNLVTNAFYAVHEKKQANPTGYDPEVSISTKLKNNTIEIKVSDNGDGIPENIKEKIFQPFFTTKPTGSGTGLGLSLSYDIVKAHDGKMKVESLPAGQAGEEGVGTTFSINLPFNINQ